MMSSDAYSSRRDADSVGRCGGEFYAMKDPRRLHRNESGPELLEWVVVTLIMILAIFAILQAVGPG